MQVSDALIEQIASLTAEGLGPEEIRGRLDLDVAFIRRVQALDTFPEALRAVSETAWELWTEAQAQSLARRKVKLAAREDAPEHYNMLRDLVRHSTELKDGEKAGILKELIRFSGAVDEHVEDETIQMTPTQLANLQETLLETRTAPSTAQRRKRKAPRPNGEAP